MKIYLFDHETPSKPSPFSESVSKHPYKPQTHKDTKKNLLKIKCFVTLSFSGFNIYSFLKHSLQRGGFGRGCLDAHNLFWFIVRLNVYHKKWNCFGQHWYIFSAVQNYIYASTFIENISQFEIYIIISKIIKFYNSFFKIYSKPFGRMWLIFIWILHYQLFLILYNIELDYLCLN